MAGGIALQMGTRFTVISRTVIRQRSIKIHKTGKLVFINGEVKPLWANNNWDDDRKVDELFDLSGIECKIAEHIVDSDDKLNFYLQAFI